MSPAAEAGVSTGLQARIRVHRDAFDVRVDLELAPGERLAVLGPNGSGKSTVLGALAGTIDMFQGSIVLTRGGVQTMLNGPGRRPLPSHQRGITLVEQRPLLFPHLDLRANVAFGPRSQETSRRDANQVAAQWLERVGLAQRARERPHRLSGGQQQRVALARAFAAEPEVLLLDEPFAALDAESTPAVRGLLATELERSATTSVLVTHHLPDAWQLADRCVVMVRGQVVEEATPEELATMPRSRFGAVLAGFCVVDGVAERGGLRVDGNSRAGSAWVPGLPDGARPPVEGAAALGVVSPGDVELVGADTSGARVDGVLPYGVLPGVVETVEVRGGLLRIGAQGGLVAEVPTGALSGLLPEGPPRAGQTLLFRPVGLRLVGMSGNHEGA
ncbi:sulfate/molybdate ABC transporter ATP-binding protein [Galactobacter sp.]|uniref:sulfate/molybdate ABC transporter ATP-binding protein n=1 Tax=Galactobacter sp. TaxID=2676125 RepID=UPI0025C35042|nr:ABC transporter ATP-binding protein [Galactobacter sp.]